MLATISPAVHIVGAGPGDPELLTLKAHRLLESADVVLYDSLVGERIVDELPGDAELIPIGKDILPAPTRQTEINRLLIENAKLGRAVVRLKGGDPTIFGRLAEEIDVLLEHGIPFEVVPGISSATAASSALGLSLTHREFASSVTFLTGHQALDKPQDLIRWKNLVLSGSTLVIYMGVAQLERISDALQAHGMSANMPVAIVERVSLDDERWVTSRLDMVAEKAELLGVKSPAIILVGQVVSQLNWKG